MLIVHTDKHLLHNPKKYFSMGKMGNYPEQPSRIETILKAIRKRKVGELVEPTDFGLDPILKVHSKEYVKYLNCAFEEWIRVGGSKNGVIPDTFAVHIDNVYRDITINSGNILAQMGVFTFDAATVIAKDTYTAAYEAAQVAITAVDMLVSQKLSSAFALTRPPGHHSSEELLGGFCFFNNAAILTRHLIDKYDAKVAILDIDYHHGNGTQEIFYENSNPLFVSIHNEASDPYFWGSKEFTGKGEGEGFNHNIELPNYTGDAVYLQALEETIDAKIKPFKPDYFVVSLGVDTFVGDPVGTFTLTSECFTKIGQLLRTVDVPTVFVMEGGYDSPHLGTNVCNVLQGFEGIEYTEPSRWFSMWFKKLIRRFQINIHPNK